MTSLTPQEVHRAPLRRRLQRPALLLLAIVVSATLCFPIYWMLVTSLTPAQEVLSRTPPLLPDLTTMTLRGYEEVLTLRPVLSWLWVSVRVTAGAVAISVVVSCLGGYSLSRLHSRTQRAMGYSLLVGRMLPGTLLVIPLFLVFSLTGLTNSVTGLVLANTTAIIPFGCWMMKAFFDTIPAELEDAAYVDGCSRLEALWRVVLPVSAPGVAAIAIYAAVLAWSDFLFARTLVTQSSLWTLTVGVASFVGEYVVNWNGIMAAGIISLLPISILFVALERFLVGGLTGGSVKG